MTRNDLRTRWERAEALSLVEEARNEVTRLADLDAVGLYVAAVSHRGARKRYDAALDHYSSLTAALMPQEA